MVIIGFRITDVVWLSGPDQFYMASVLLPDQSCSAMTYTGGNKSLSWDPCAVVSSCTSSFFFCMPSERQNLKSVKEISKYVGGKSENWVQI